MSVLLKLVNNIEGQFVIEISGRLYPNETDCWDRNWLNTQVLVKTKEFNGKVSMKTLTAEFVTFYEGLMLLTKAVNEDVEFTTMEEQLYINIQRQQKEKYLLKGKLIGTRPDGGLLEFTFHLTEDDLNKLTEDICTITKEYPVYGETEK